MLRTPHKSLSRNFLRSLIDNRFVSQGGKEYSPEEVTNLYHEKCTRLADKEFNELLREETERHKKSWSLVEAAKQITDFQASLFKPEIRTRESLAQKTLSTVDAISPDTKNYLNSEKLFDSIVEHNQELQQSQRVEPLREKNLSTRRLNPSAESITNSRGAATMKKKKGFLTFNDVPAKNKRKATNEEVKREIDKSLKYLRELAQ